MPSANIASPSAFTEEQRARYERNMLIPGLGETGQDALANARVLIVGLGGLGSAAGFYLAAAGVGTLGLMDFDRVSLSNLQRQILHSTRTLGRPKTDSAAAALAALNPGIHMESIEEQLTPENAGERLGRYDAVVEACDTFEAKYLINDACVELGIPFATAGILALSGQGMFVVPGRTACLRCAVPEVPQGIPTTAQLGVLGPVPGILGSLQALEVIRWISGMWKPESDGSGRLHIVDGETMRLRTMRLPRRPECRCTRADGGALRAESRSSSAPAV